MTTPYNIYFGTIGKTLGVKYRFTRECRNEEEAKGLARKACESYYYKNEGRYGIPSFSQISKESKLTGIDIEKLYEDHINDLCRWYAIPYEVDTISSDDVKW